MGKQFRETLIITIILGCITILLWLTNADRQVALLVVEPDGKWPGVDHLPWTFFYDYAGVPGFLLAGSGLLVFLCSYFVLPLQRVRKQGLFLVLLLVLGPGLIVNVTFKDNLGRARPREIKEFGGTHDYTEIWQPGITGKNSSFPSGHASIAFYVMAPWFFYRKGKKTRALVFLSIGIGFGILIGITRILQGGHFLSDVIWAGGIVYLTGQILAWIMRVENNC